MTQDENIRLTKMEQSVEEIRTDISVIKSALIGNELAGDRGLVGKVTMLQAEIDYLKTDLKTLQEEKTRNDVYIKQITYVVGALVTGAVATLIKFLFF